jgi:hypothetical protein
MGDVASFVAFRKIFKATLLEKFDFSRMAHGEGGMHLVKRA